ncbi:hypothetical protein, partial [Psychrobacter glacincola]|uniref:hypothetical protein n=1 Tax=Psychrobacter glacincola TaxID=56810 RepID=UPI003BB79EF8
ISKTLQCCWYKFFAASVCVGTASKKNEYQQYLMYRYYFSLTITFTTIHPVNLRHKKAPNSLAVRRFYLDLKYFYKTVKGLNLEWSKTLMV